jgi:hypothetical protein
MQRSFILHDTRTKKSKTQRSSRNLILSQQTEWLCAFAFSMLLWFVYISVAAADVYAPSLSARGGIDGQWRDQFLSEAESGLDLGTFGLGLGLGLGRPGLDIITG